MVEGSAITGRPPKSPTTCAPRIPGLAAFGPGTSRLSVGGSAHRRRLHRPGGQAVPLTSGWTPGTRPVAAGYLEFSKGLPGLRTGAKKTDG